MIADAHKLDEYRKSSHTQPRQEITNITHRYHYDVFQEHFTHYYKQSLSPVYFRPVNTVSNLSYGLQLDYNLQEKIDSLDFVVDSREFVATNKELYKRLKCSQYSYFCSRNPEGLVGDLKYLHADLGKKLVKRQNSLHSARCPASADVYDVHEAKNRCYTPRQVYQVLPAAKKRSTSQTHSVDATLRTHFTVALPRSAVLSSYPMLACNKHAYPYLSKSSNLI